jgi:hypothetical protein
LRLHVVELARARQVGEFAVFGVDGTMIDCPRTIANEAGIGVSGKARSSPQVLLTTVIHLDVGLPYCWRHGRARGSERADLRSMLGHLPDNALLVGDAGYTGFDVMNRINRSGRAFVIRVGAAVGLLEELGSYKREGRDTVYLWPKEHRSHAPLTLRLIRIKTAGEPMFLVTNVLESSRLSKSAAREVYRRRWEVEIFFRDLKQTLDRRKMLSDSPVRARCELEWSLIGALVLGRLTVSRLMARRVAPQRASAAEALRVLRGVLREPHARSNRFTPLMKRLGMAVIDSYKRKRPKEARDWCHKKRQRPPRPPQTRKATAAEKRLARQIIAENAPTQLE